MAQAQIDYPKLVERALRHVVRDTLTLVAEQGLPGAHHLYITFRTDHPGVTLPDSLRARYPSEMTIVLQFEFWGLEVGQDGFGVTLSFANVSHRLEIPFAAITVFADPSVEFGLQFTYADKEAAAARRPGPHLQPVASARPIAADGEDSAAVVTLDQFRKK
jgi:hypothetical protein